MSKEKYTYEVIEYVSIDELNDENREPMYWSKGNEKELEEKALEMIDLDNEKERMLYSMILVMSNRINAVRELHYDNPYKNGCSACSSHDKQVEWPCDTLLELDEIDEDTIIDSSNFDVTTIVLGRNGEELTVLKKEEQAI